MVEVRVDFLTDEDWKKVMEDDPGLSDSDRWLLKTVTVSEECYNSFTFGM